MPVKVNLLRGMPKRRINKTPMVLLAVTATSLSFAGLWIRERHRAPATPLVRTVVRTVVREVPKEIVKTIEKEPKLTDEQASALDLGRRFMQASFLQSESDALYGIRALKVNVRVGEVVGQSVYDERIRGKLEMALLRNGILIDENSPVTLSLEIDGRWDAEKVRLTHTSRLRVYDLGFLVRGTEIRRGNVEVWMKASFGYAGRGTVEEAIFGCVEQLTESFAQEMLGQKAKQVAENRP